MSESVKNETANDSALSSATRERPLQIKLALTDAWISLSFCPFEMKRPLDWDALPTEEERFEAMELRLKALCASLATTLGASDEGSRYVRRLTERQRFCVRMRVKTILAVGNERLSGSQGNALARSIMDMWAAERLTHWTLTCKTGVESLRDAGDVVYLDHQFRHEREVEQICVSFGQQNALESAALPNPKAPKAKPRRL